MFVVDIHALPNISIISIIYDVDGLSCQNWKIIINDPSIAPLGRDGRVMSWMEIIEYLKFQHIYIKAKQLSPSIKQTFLQIDAEYVFFILQNVKTFI